MTLTRLVPRLCALILGSTLALGCGSDDPADGADAGASADAADDGGVGPLRTDPFEGLPTGRDQWEDLCAKGYNDTVTAAFCENANPPSITSFAELRNFLGLTGDNIGNQSQLRVTGVFHSTAVSGRSVTPLNPRIFFMPRNNGQINPTNPQPNAQYNIIAFSRGETFAELASKDLTTGEPRFFLFKFEPACESNPSGCNNADLFTPTIESNWNGYTLYDDETIDNTVFACIRCHTNNAGRKMLRMQEQRNPWMHWFYEEIPDNNAAIVTFEDAHAGTRYGDFPVSVYRGSRPSNLQRLIQNNETLNQPNEFDSDEIRTEVEQTGTSPTWDALYAEVVAGRAIPVPYFGNPPFDGNWDLSTPFQPILDPSSRLGQMVEAYKDTVSGAIPRDQMPDIRDTFLPEAIDALYRPAPGLDGRGIMVQVCRQCHNNTTNPALSRARFNIDQIDTMDRAEKDLAIERLTMPQGDIRHMPPQRFYTLSDAERQLVVDALNQ